MKLIYYTASWCGPCRTFKPQVEQEAAERGLAIVFIDVDANPDIAAFDNIMTVPTVMMVGGDAELSSWDEIDRVTGASLPTLKKTLDNLARSGYNGQLAISAK